MINQNASANTNPVADENGNINCTNCSGCTECESCEDCGADRTSDSDENEVGAE